MNEKEKAEEVNLSDYAKVVIRKKKMIQKILFATVALAVILSFILPKVYRIDTSIEVGKMKQGDLIQPIEDPLQLKQKIDNDVYGVLVRDKLKIPEDKYPKLTTESSKGINLVMIETESSRPDQAKDILKEIDSLIVSEHGEKVKIFRDLMEKNIKTYEDKIKLSSDNVDRVKNKITFSEDEQKNMEAKVSALQKVFIYNQDPGTQFALFDTKEKLDAKKQEIEDLYSKANDLQAAIESSNAEINSLKSSLDDINATEAVKAPSVSEKPVSPNLLVNIIVGLLLGLLFGMILAFGSDWWEKNKKDIK